jgi:hypothetical protein
MTTTINAYTIRQGSSFGPSVGYDNNDFGASQTYECFYSDGTPILETLIPTPSLLSNTSFDEEDVFDEPSYTPDHVFHLFSLSDSKNDHIPMKIVSEYPTWSQARSVYQQQLEEQKYNEKMAPFFEFNRQCDESVAQELHRRFMANIPTMSKAFKQRMEKEAAEAAAKRQVPSDHTKFWEKWNTSKTAWGHKTGGKNKGLSMKDASSDKVAAEIAELRRARRAAAKVKRDAEESERAAKFQEMEARPLSSRKRKPRGSSERRSSSVSRSRSRDSLGVTRSRRLRSLKRSRSPSRNPSGRRLVVRTRIRWQRWRHQSVSRSSSRLLLLP